MYNIVGRKSRVIEKVVCGDVIRRDYVCIYIFFFRQQYESHFAQTLDEGITELMDVKFRMTNYQNT